MPRSVFRNFAYARNTRAEPTTSARASDSAATRIDAPGGMVTRAGGPSPPPHEARSARALPDASQRMLQEYRGGQGVDVAGAILRLAAHLTDGAAGRGRGESLVHQLDGETGALLELLRDLAY